MLDHGLPASAGLASEGRGDPPRSGQAQAAVVRPRVAWAESEVGAQWQNPIQIEQGVELWLKNCLE